MAGLYESVKSVTINSVKGLAYVGGYAAAPAVASYAIREGMISAITPRNAAGFVARRYCAEMFGIGGGCLAGPIGAFAGAAFAEGVTRLAFYGAESAHAAYRKYTQNQDSLNNNGVDWDAAEDPDPEALIEDGDLHIHNNALEYHQAANPPASDTGLLSKISGGLSFFSRNQPTPAVQQPVQVVMQPKQVIDENVLRQALQFDALATGIVFKG